MLEPGAQRVEQTWETPSPADIVAISADHVAAMEASLDNLIWKPEGMPHIVVHTVGRKSGKEHKVALPTWTDSEGHLIITASFGGAPTNPDWLKNIQKRGDPYITIRTQDGLIDVIPEILDPDSEDYSSTWAALNEDRAWYDKYQELAGDRQIPLVRLVAVAQVS